jgi:hypothetical protein
MNNIEGNYGGEFLNKLYENFNDHWERQNSAVGAVPGEEPADDSGGIFGKITAGIHAVTVTIQDIVNKAG